MALINRQEPYLDNSSPFGYRGSHGSPHLAILLVTLSRNYGLSGQFGRNKTDGRSLTKVPRPFSDPHQQGTTCPRCPTGNPHLPVFASPPIHRNLTNLIQTYEKDESRRLADHCQHLPRPRNMRRMQLNEKSPR